MSAIYSISPELLPVFAAALTPSTFNQKWGISRGCYVHGFRPERSMFPLTNSLSCKGSFHASLYIEGNGRIILALDIKAQNF